MTQSESSRTIWDWYSSFNESDVSFSFLTRKREYLFEYVRLQLQALGMHWGDFEQEVAHLLIDLLLPRMHGKFYIFQAAETFDKHEVIRHHEPLIRRVLNQMHSEIDIKVKFVTDQRSPYFEITMRWDVCKWYHTLEFVVQIEDVGSASMLIGSVVRRFYVKDESQFNSTFLFRIYLDMRRCSLWSKLRAHDKDSRFRINVAMRVKETGTHDSWFDVLQTRIRKFADAKNAFKLYPTSDSLETAWEHCKDEKAKKDLFQNEFVNLSDEECRRMNAFMTVYYRVPWAIV